MNRFYEQVVKAHGLSQKVVLEGLSRGGLFAFNWAAKHPDKVAALYVDAPVCDFKSWPAGKGKGKGAPADWKRCMEAYGLTEEEALAYPHNPIDNLKPLAEKKIPILAVCGDADDVVPLAENMEIVRKRYEALGGEVKMIVKPGIGHHPHSLPDPAPIVDFVLKHRP
jgi:pimeloyl-ACP methyl ester carboxylesterase